MFNSYIFGVFSLIPYNLPDNHQVKLLTKQLLLANPYFLGRDRPLVGEVAFFRDFLESGVL